MEFLVPPSSEGVIGAACLGRASSEEEASGFEAAPHDGAGVGAELNHGGVVAHQRCRQRLHGPRVLRHGPGGKNFCIYLRRISTSEVGRFL